MKTHDYIDDTGRKIREDMTPSGKIIKIDIEAEQLRIDKLIETQQRLKNGEIDTQTATKIINEFGRKNKMHIK